MRNSSAQRLVRSCIVSIVSIVSIVLGTVAVVSLPVTAAAQANPLSCNPAIGCGAGEPPTIWFTPTVDGTTTKTSPITVQINWCDDGGLNSTSRTVTLNGSSVSSTWGGQTYTGCWVHDTSTVVLSLSIGSNSLIASIKDNFGQLDEQSASIRYDPREFTVSPKGTNVTVYSETNNTQTFTVTNHETSTQTYTLTIGCTGAVSGCTADSSSLTVSPSHTDSTRVHYTAGTYNSTGAVSVIFTSTSISYDVDTGSVNVTANGVATTATFAANLNDNQQLGLCANHCFHVAYSHSTVPYVSLGQARSATLVYNGARVALRPFVYADVTLAAGAPPPEELTLQAQVNGASVTFLNGETTLHFKADSTVLVPGQTIPVRLGGEFDASSYSTGMYPMTITATAVYADHTESATDTTKLMVVNLRTPDLLPVAGWTVAGVQHLFVQSDSTILIVEGDGSGVYFGCKTYTSRCSGPSGDFTTLMSAGSGGSLTYTRAYPDSSKVVFNNLGQMTAARDRWGTEVDYTYSSGHLSAIQDPVMRYNGGASKTEIEFWYSSGSFTVAMPGPNGTAASAARGIVVTYNGSNRVTRITDPDSLRDSLTYDASGRLTTVTDRRGGTVTYAYDTTSWLLTSATLPSVALDAGAGGATTMGSPVLQDTPWQTVGVPRTTTASSHATPVRTDTLVARVTDADTVTTTYTTDRWGQPLVVVNALTDTTRIVRSGVAVIAVTNALGQVDSTLYTGAFLTYAHPHDQPATSYAYDAWGMVRAISGGGNPTETLGYSALTHTIADTLAGTYVSTYWLDSLGRDTMVADPADHLTHVRYDAVFGNPDSTIAAGGQWTRTTYNAYGLDSLHAASGTTPASLTLYDKLDRVTAAYDTIGGKPTTYTYDALFQTVVRDPKGQVYKTDVNALGWPTKVYDPADTTAWAIYQAYQYDAAGLVKHWQNRRSQWSAYQYDALGRVTSYRDAVAPADSFQYLHHGRVAIASNSIETDTIAGGSAGSDTTTTVFGSTWFRRTWSRTAGVHVDTLTLATSVSGLTYLPRTRYWNASTGMLDSVMIGTSTVRFTYDTELLRDSTLYPSYAKAELTTSTHEHYQSNFSIQALDSTFSRTYAYDSLGRIVSESRKNGYASGWVYEIRNYAYNGAGALRWYQRAQSHNKSCDPNYGCTWPGDSATQAYGYRTYDPALNLLAQVDSTHGTTVDSATFAVGDRLTSWEGATYSYDADGNRTAKHVGSTETDYTWSANGQLLEVRSGADTIDYAYNALGQLVRRRTNGTSDRYFVWQDGQLLTELDGTLTNRLNEFAYLGVDQPLARITGNGSTTIEYAQTDGRGDVIGLTNGSSITQHLDYGPWGDVELETGDSLPQTRLGWKGLPWEGGITSMYYARARWYDPASRSFASEDPLGLAGGANTYSYGSGDPVDARDPSGLSELLCFQRSWDEVTPNDAGGWVYTTHVEGIGCITFVGPLDWVDPGPALPTVFSVDLRGEAFMDGSQSDWVTSAQATAIFQQVGRDLMALPAVVNCSIDVYALALTVPSDIAVVKSGIEGLLDLAAGRVAAGQAARYALSDIMGSNSATSFLRQTAAADATALHAAGVDALMAAREEYVDGLQIGLVAAAAKSAASGKPVSSDLVPGVASATNSLDTRASCSSLFHN